MSGGQLYINGRDHPRVRGDKKGYLKIVEA